MVAKRPVRNTIDKGAMESLPGVKSALIGRIALGRGDMK
jgi:hypothetical protein